MAQENLIIPFVQLIYCKPLIELNDKQEVFKNRCLEVMGQYPKKHDWLCDTYSTLKTDYNFLEDKVFVNLVSAVKDAVVDFSKEYRIEDIDPKLEDSWINVYDPNEYQEYHLHTGHHFSAVYYVEVPENSGNIMFQNKFEYECMKPLPTKEWAQANSATYWLEPKTGYLIIFRSNTPHMVMKNKSGKQRISIAMNFSFR